MAALHEPRDDDGDWGTRAFAGAMYMAEAINAVSRIHQGLLEAGKKAKNRTR